MKCPQILMAVALCAMSFGVITPSYYPQTRPYYPQASYYPQPQPYYPQPGRPQMQNLNMQENQKKAALSKFRDEVRELVANKYKGQLKEFFEQQTATKAAFDVKGREDQFKRIIQQIMRDTELIPRDPILTRKETNTAIILTILNSFSNGTQYYITNESVLFNLLESIIMN